MFITIVLRKKKPVFVSASFKKQQCEDEESDAVFDLNYTVFILLQKYLEC